MHKIDHKNTGFGVVEIIIAVVVVLVVGLISWRLYDASKNKPSASIQQPNSNQSNEQTSNNTPTDTATYLDIKQLGVKIKLNDQVKDATFVTRTLDDGSLVAYFSTQSFASLDPACDATSGQLGALERTTTSTDRLGNQLIPDGQRVFKFENYYYIYTTPQALCSEKVRSIVDSTMSAFQESLKTLQLDK